MSWKGFQKAVARLPQMVMVKAGYTDETVDAEFAELEERFKLFEQNAKKLHEDAKKFKDALSMMLAHQASFAATLLEVYLPIGRSKVVSPRGSVTAEAGGEGTAVNETIARSSRSLAKETPPASLRAVEEYARITESARASLQPDLEIIERRLVAPTADLLQLIDRVKRLIVKRSHKLLDYDRHRESVKKMKEKTDRSATDERTLGKYESSLDQAAREYSNINNILLQQIPMMLSLKAPFIDPCFLTLYWYQMRVHQTLVAGSKELMRIAGGAFESSGLPGDANINIDKFISSSVEMQAALLSELTLVARNRNKQQPTSPMDDQGYYTASSTEVSPTGDKPPTYDDGTSKISAAGGFRSMHQSNAPQAGGGGYSYPNPLTAGSGATFSGSGASAWGGVSPTSATAIGDGASRKSYVIALYDYQAQAEGDLTFSRDDKIEVVQKTDNPNDWWTGTLNGVTGQFPANYTVEI